MSKIRSEATRAEIIVFRYLRGEGLYFQRHYRKAPGSPDIALPRKKKAVFIDGDFWHGKTIDSLVLRRGTNDHWVKKIRRNMERDRKNEQGLLATGWSFIRIDEKDILRKGTRGQIMQQIKDYLGS